jgi:hypothetical protein
MPYVGPAIAVGTLGVVGLLTYPTLGEAVVAPDLVHAFFREGPDLPE